MNMPQPGNAFDCLELLNRVILSIDEHRAKSGLGPYFKPLKGGEAPIKISSHSKTLKGARTKVKSQLRTAAAGQGHEMVVFLELMGGESGLNSAARERVWCMLDDEVSPSANAKSGSSRLAAITRSIVTSTYERSF